MKDPLDPASAVVSVAGRMSPAELRVVREYLGLTAQWLAERLEVARPTLARWEAGGSPIPDRVRLQIEALEADTARTVADGADAVKDLPNPVVVTYRTDADYEKHGPVGGWPASWHRAVVARIAHEVDGLRIEYRHGPVEGIL